MKYIPDLKKEHLVQVQEMADDANPEEVINVDID